MGSFIISGKMETCVSSVHIRVWWMNLLLCESSYIGENKKSIQPTVKRGVSFLMSSRETSIPITPRINWFWYCGGTRIIEKRKHTWYWSESYFFNAPRHSCHLCSSFCWKQGVFRWWPDPVPEKIQHKTVAHLNLYIFKWANAMRKRF